MSNNDLHNGPLLLVEDDEATRSFLNENFTADGYEVTALPTSAVEPGEAKQNIIILDVRSVDGLRLLGELRQSGTGGNPAAAVLAIGNGGGTLERIRALDRGADDAFGRPFSYPEVRARVAAARRRQRPGRAHFEVGPLTLNTVSRTVALRGELVAMSRQEFDLLSHLIRDPTRVFTKAELLRAVWGYKTLGATRTLDAHACRLRRRLAQHGDRFVVNVWGVGYRLIDAAPSADA